LAENGFLELATPTGSVTIRTSIPLWERALLTIRESTKASAALLLSLFLLCCLLFFTVRALLFSSKRQPSLC
jgi:hypothetical protein